MLLTIKKAVFSYYCTNINTSLDRTGTSASIATQAVWTPWLRCSMGHSECSVGIAWLIMFLLIPGK